MSALNQVTPELALAKVTVDNKQDKITKEQLLELVKTLAVLDEDKEINLTKIAQKAGKRIDLFMKSKCGEIKEIAITQKVVTDVIRQKRGGSGEDGTYTSNKKVFLLFLSWLSPMIMISMLDVVDELFTRGYASIDNKPRYTLQESVIALTVAYKFEDYLGMKETLIRIVKDIAKNDDSKSTIGVKIAKAYNTVYNRLNWDDYKEREAYEQRCYKLGLKPLKIISKMDMCFFGKPDRLLDFLIEFILIECPAFPVEENISIIKLAIKELDLYPIKDMTTESLFEEKKSREVFELSSKSLSTVKLLIN